MTKKSFPKSTGKNEQSHQKYLVIFNVFYLSKEDSSCICLIVVRFARCNVSKDPLTGRWEYCRKVTLQTFRDVSLVSLPTQ